MFKSFLAATLAAVSSAYRAPTAAQRASVKEWDDLMTSYGYRYEYYTTTTDDDWELALFRILPKDPNQSVGKTVFFQHGNGMDAEFWFQGTIEAQAPGDTSKPAFLTLADDGYDVWMGNNRGSKYSNVNPRWPDADNRSSPNYAEQNFAKYDYSWDTLGLSDLPANLDKVTAVSGNEKVTYVGYSQGCTQMLYALTKDDEKIAKKVDRAILMAAVAYTASAPIGLYKLVFPVLRHENVNVLLRKDKWAQDVENVCNPPPGDFMADARQVACAFMKAQWGEEISTKSMEHYLQCGIADAWQEYRADFGSLRKYDAPLIGKFENVNAVPIQIVQGTADGVAAGPGVQRLMAELGDTVERYTEVAGAGHEWFATETASDEFLEILRTGLAL